MLLRAFERGETDRDRRIEAVRLLNRQHGEGIFASDYLEGVLAKLECLAIAALEGDELIGVAVARILDKTPDFYGETFGATAAKHIASHAKVLVLEASSVVEPFQRRGIGLQLAQARMDWGKRAGCTA